MRRSQLRDRCRQRLERIGIPVPFVVAALCDDVATRRRRPIRLHALTIGGGPCGLWVAAESADHIFHEAATSPLHRDHIILHELCHLLCDHEPASVLDDELARLLFPHLDAGLVRRILARSSYSAIQEQEAELLASMIRERADRRGQPDNASGDGVPAAVRRVEAALQ
jgi:hypothetical protein